MTHNSVKPQEMVATVFALFGFLFKSMQFLEIKKVQRNSIVEENQHQIFETSVLRNTHISVKASLFYRTIVVVSSHLYPTNKTLVHFLKPNITKTPPAES